MLAPVLAWSAGWEAIGVAMSIDGERCGRNLLPRQCRGEKDAAEVLQFIAAEHIIFPASGRRAITRRC